MFCFCHFRKGQAWTTTWKRFPHQPFILVLIGDHLKPAQLFCDLKTGVSSSYTLLYAVDFSYKPGLRGVSSILFKIHNAVDAHLTFLWHWCLPGQKLEKRGAVRTFGQAMTLRVQFDSSFQDRETETTDSYKYVIKYYCTKANGQEN